MSSDECDRCLIDENGDVDEITVEEIIESTGLVIDLDRIGPTDDKVHPPQHQRTVSTLSFADKRKSSYMLYREQYHSWQFTSAKRRMLFTLPFTTANQRYGL